MNNDAKVMHDELFSHGGLSLDRLRTLCKVAEHGSIAKAAEGDPVRQSQFSRQLRDLGQFFEIELTRRRGKGAELTPAGRELAGLGREILGALHDYRQAQQTDKTIIRLGAGESLIQWHILPQIKRLRLELPTVVLSLKNLRGEEIITQLTESRLDFGLVAADDLPEAIQAVKLGVLRYRIFVSPVKGGAARVANWREALKLPMVGLEGDGSLMRKVRQVAEKHEIQPRPAVLCSSLPGVATVLKEIEGFAILPEAAEREGLTAMEAPFLREFDRTIRLAWSKRRLVIQDGMSRWRKKLSSVLSW